MFIFYILSNCHSQENLSVAIIFICLTFSSLQPIDASMKKEVETALAGFVKQGEKTQIHYEVCQQAATA